MITEARAKLGLVAFVATLFFLIACVFVAQGHAQTTTTTSLLDPSRLSVGLRAYRSFDEKPTIAGSYTSGWWVGVPLAWELTSPNDPSVKLPISLAGAVDFGVPIGSQVETIRAYIGVVALLKRAGH